MQVRFRSGARSHWFDRHQRQSQRHRARQILGDLSSVATLTCRQWPRWHVVSGHADGICIGWNHAINIWQYSCCWWFHYSPFDWPNTARYQWRGFLLQLDEKEWKVKRELVIAPACCVGSATIYAHEWDSSVWTISPNSRQLRERIRFRKDRGHFCKKAQQTDGSRSSDLETNWTLLYSVLCQRHVQRPTTNEYDSLFKPNHNENCCAIGDLKSRLPLCASRLASAFPRLQDLYSIQAEGTNQQIWGNWVMLQFRIV